MNYISFITVVLPFVFAFISYAVGRKNEKARNILVVSACAFVFILTVVASFTAFGIKCASGLFGLSFEIDGFRAVYSCITSFMFLISTMLSPQYFSHHGNVNRYYLFFLMTLGATLGVFLSSDLLTTFTFFEIMSFTSYMWVIQEQDKDAMSAGKTYLTIAVLGGLVTLMGLFLLYSLTGTLEISALYEKCAAVTDRGTLYIASFCVLVGFGAKAGMFPLHIWLPKAHPVAPAPASALLSGILTKAGIFGVLVITCNMMRGDKLWGSVLLVLGIVTMLIGAVKAVFSVNIKYILACSSLSQIGFILVGVSMICLLGNENALAVNGTVLYMINHSIVKLALFLTCGAIFMGAHTLNLNELRGYGRNKPLYSIVFLIGACSLSGIPGTCGYLSKTLIHESIVEYASFAGTAGNIAEILFLFSGGLTAAYMCKLYITIFVEKPTEHTAKDSVKPTFMSCAALILSCAALPVMGVLPHALSEKISYLTLPFLGAGEKALDMRYFSSENLSGVGISLFVGAAVYLLFIRLVLAKEKDGVRVYTDIYPSWLSVEALVYIPVGKAVIYVFTRVCKVLASLTDTIIPLLVCLLGKLSAIISGLTEILIKYGIAAVSVITRAVCDLTDAFVYLMSKTVFRRVGVKEEGRSFEYSRRIGEYLDRHRKPDGNKESAAELLPRITETVKETTDDITEGFSFALIMACVGVCAILLIIILT